MMSDCDVQKMEDLMSREQSWEEHAAAKIDGHDEDIVKLTSIVRNLTARIMELEKIQFPLKHAQASGVVDCTIDGKPIEGVVGWSLGPESGWVLSPGEDDQLPLVPIEPAHEVELDLTCGTCGKEDGDCDHLIDGVFPKAKDDTNKKDGGK